MCQEYKPIHKSLYCIMNHFFFAVKTIYGKFLLGLVSSMNHTKIWGSGAEEGNFSLH